MTYRSEPSAAALNRTASPYEGGNGIALRALSQEVTLTRDARAQLMLNARRGWRPNSRQLAPCQKGPRTMSKRGKAAPLRLVDDRDGGLVLGSIPGQVFRDGINGRPAAPSLAVDWSGTVRALEQLHAEQMARIEAIRASHPPKRALLAAMHIEPMRAVLLSLEDVLPLARAKLPIAPEPPEAA